MTWWLWMLACDPGSSDTDGAAIPVPTADTASVAPPLSFTAAPVLRAPEGDTVFLARILEARTTRPTVMSWSVDHGRQRTTSAASDGHELPILGFEADREHTLRVSFTADDGEALTWETTVVTEPLPEPFPVLEVLVDDPGRRSPGWTLVGAERIDLLQWNVGMLFDEDMRLVWVRSGAVKLWAEEPTPQGTLLGLLGGAAEIAELSWEGLVLTSIASDDGPLHHELIPLDDGSAWTLGFDTVTEPAYPVDYERTATQPADIRDNPVLRVAADGSTLARYSLTERLDPQRIGYNSLDPKEGGLDWGHANGLALDDDGGLVVSLRHQDALVKLSGEGEVRWILGDPAGWGPEHAPLLLQPVGPLEWPYHAHAPAFDDDGLLWVFDNHNNGVTPYEGPQGEPQWSRAVAFRVDERAGTVEQVHALDQTSTGRVFAQAQGDADPLPGGTVLVTYGQASGQEDPGLGVEVSHEEIGWARWASRVVEMDPSAPGQPALDLRVRGEEAGQGWSVYRSSRFTSPWGDAAR